MLLKTICLFKIRVDNNVVRTINIFYWGNQVNLRKNTAFKIGLLKLFPFSNVVIFEIFIRLVNEQIFMNAHYANFLLLLLWYKNTTANCIYILFQNWCSHILCILFVFSIFCFCFQIRFECELPLQLSMRNQIYGKGKDFLISSLKYIDFRDFLNLFIGLFSFNNFLKCLETFLHRKICGQCNSTRLSNFH